MTRAALVPAASVDPDALARFLSADGALGSPTEFWKSRFQLWWDSNPAFTPATPRGWTLQDGGRLVGFLGNVPSKMLVDGKPATVHSITSWYVAPEHREESLTLLLAAMDAAKGTLLFDATPTDDVAAILEGLGFRRFPWGRERESLVVIDAARTLAAAAPVLPGLARLAGPALALAQRLRARALERAPELATAEVTAPDAAFDSFWERTRSDFRVTNIRDAAALRWHLADPFIHKRLFTVSADGRLAGWALFRERLRRGLRSLDCADVWLDPAVPGALANLIRRALATDPEADLLAFPHFSEGLGARLRALGLFERALRFKGYVFGDEEVLDRLERSPSYFCALQGDQSTALP